MNELRKKNNLSFFLVCLKIGIGVLIYRGCIDVLSYGILPLIGILDMIAPENLVLLNSVNYLYTAVVSLVSFLSGAIVLWIILRIGKSKNYQPTYWRFRIIPSALFLIIATIALNFAMAEINALLITLLSPGADMSFGINVTSDISVIEVILLFISMAVIPGIVEEIMFRGIILTNLAPYGKGMAVVASGLLFGLMHMNPSQFFYTTVLGIILGYIYLKTRSIWICIIIHFVNNSLGVIQQIIYQCFNTQKATKLMAIMMIIIAVLGIISIGVLLIVRARNRKKAPEEIGCFGRIYDSALSYEARPVTKWKKMLLFFSPSVSVFTIIVFVSMITAMMSTFMMGLLIGFFPGVFAF